MVEHGGRHRSHQPDRAAAIDEADVVLGEGLAERDGGFHKAGICTGAGATIDTDSPDFVRHDFHVTLQRKRVKPAGFAWSAESIRKCLGIVKEIAPAEGAYDI